MRPISHFLRLGTDYSIVLKRTTYSSKTLTKESRRLGETSKTMKRKYENSKWTLKIKKVRNKINRSTRFFIREIKK